MIYFKYHDIGQNYWAKNINCSWIVKKTAVKKPKLFFRIIVGGESPWKHLPFIKSIWRLASPNALNRSNLMRVSALRLFSRWVFLSCIAERADMSTSASPCWSLYCLRLYNNPYITTSTRSLITLWSKYLRGVGAISGALYYDIYS